MKYILIVVPLFIAGCNVFGPTPEERNVSKLEKSFFFGEAVYGMAAKDNSIYFGSGRDGKIYKLNIAGNKISSILSTRLDKINSLAIVGSKIYIGSIEKGKIFSYELNSGDFSGVVKDVKFPDGLGSLDDQLYFSVENHSAVLYSLNISDSTESRINTAVPDPVSIDAYKGALIVLDESGDIYKVNPSNGKTEKIFDIKLDINDLHSYGGVESLVIVNDTIYISNTSDNYLYKVNIRP